MKQMLDLPFLHKFALSSDYPRLKEVLRRIGSKKALIKTLEQMKKFVDYKEDDFSHIKLLKIFSAMKEDSAYIFEVLSNKVETLHQLVEILPNFTEKYRQQYIEIFKIISKYKKEDFMATLSFLNYPHIQKAIINKRNKKDIMFMIEKIKKGFLNREETIMYRKEYGEEYKKYLEMKRNNKYEIYTQITKINIPGLKLIKDEVEASYWGKETLCCLKKGGAAEGLLKVISCSPIAGELVGTFKNNKLSSYTWDMVEMVNGKAYKTLVLDNIESPTMISEKNTEELFDIISNAGYYKTIYLGITRNDCEVNSKYEVKRRQALVPGFDKMFKAHTFMSADSSNLYVMREHKEDTELEVRHMNKSDLHLVKYIEKYIYGDIYNGENETTDILNAVTLETPCYIIDSKTNIEGYVLTKYKYLKDDGTQDKDNILKNKRVYIEDIVFSKNREALLKLNDIILDFILWCNKNEVTEVYSNPNKFSKNLVKRLENYGIKMKFEKGIENILPEHRLK